MFGKNKDKNKQKKFYHIKNLINSINDNYSIIYETKEYYYCCLSIKNVKDLFKTKINKTIQNIRYIQVSFL